MNVSRLAGTIVLALGVLVARAEAQDRPDQGSSLDTVTIDAEVEPGATIEADKVIALWSRKLGIPIVVDPQMTGLRLRVPSGQVSWGAFKKMLEFHDVIVEQRSVVGATLLFAHLRRNYPSKVAPPFPVVAPDQLAAMGDQVVTTTIKIEHGAANDIFFTVRGLLVRDVNRIGNILYVKGPETIILVDHAYNVEYYAKVIRALDVPASGMRAFKLEHANAEDAALALEPLAEPGTKVVPAPRTNQLLVRGPSAEVARMADLVAKIDVPAAVARPRFRPEAPGIALWKVATAFAIVAFIGQTILLRRFQRRGLLTKLSG